MIILMHICVADLLLNLISHVADSTTFTVYDCIKSSLIKGKQNLIFKKRQRVK